MPRYDEDTLVQRTTADYRDTVPHLFHHNAFVVLANGSDARIGSLSGRFGHFHESL